MYSRNLFVLDFARRFFVSCAKISEALALRPPLKFGCDWRKIGRKGKCMKDFESTSKYNGGKKMTKEKKKGFVLRALDTVEHVGNALPNPATIFLILTGVVIVLSAICAACGVSVTYDFLDNSKGEITQKTVAAVSLLAPDSIRHMVTTVVGNFTGFFALGTVFTIMIGVGVADGTGFMSALLRKVAEIGRASCRERV